MATTVLDLTSPRIPSPEGYLWMLANVLVSAGYVLGMRKRIKATNFKVGPPILEWDYLG